MIYINSLSFISIVSNIYRLLGLLRHMEGRKSFRLRWLNAAQSRHRHMFCWWIFDSGFAYWRYQFSIVYQIEWVFTNCLTGLVRDPLCAPVIYPAARHILPVTFPSSSPSSGIHAILPDIKNTITQITPHSASLAVEPRRSTTVF